MYITCCDKFVQIELAQGSRLLKKVLEYANKHFSKRYHLSSSLLILDDGERFKKDYLINWTYHATMQSVAFLENTKNTAQNPSQNLSVDSSDFLTPNQTSENNTKSHKIADENKEKKSAKQKRKPNAKSSDKKSKSTNDDKNVAKSMSSEANDAMEIAKIAKKDAQDFSDDTKNAKNAKEMALQNSDFDSQKNAQSTPKYNDELANILSYSHLPIRIKITNPNTLLKRIKVQIHLSNLGQILVRLPENNRVARRYIRAIFGSNILYEVDNEFCISAVGYTQSMWEGVMGLISSRIIHNIALDFEFNSNKDEDFETNGFGGEGFDSFLTREEYLLRKCYNELNVDFRDSFAEVKKQYLKLAKKFHPDNAQGKDSAEVKIFEERFKKISQAYNTIKASTTSLADKTTA